MVMRMSFEKNNGVYYTPARLADFVVKLAISSSCSKVLDPCYGEGALLVAARRRLLQLHSQSPERQLFGFDIAPLRNDIKAKCDQGLFDRGNIHERDFFSPCGSRLRKAFDIVVMNPPYVRHHRIPKATQSRLVSALGDHFTLPGTSDLWAYFVLRCFEFLREGGCLASILPWSFLKARYSRAVRESLYKSFDKLEVVVIGERMFESAEERVCVFVGQGFGSPSSHIEISYSPILPDKLPRWRSVRPAGWRNSPWTSMVGEKVQEILTRVSESIGFEPLSNFAGVRIGVVTGSNGFFVLTPEDAHELGLPKEHLRPVLRRSKDLCKLVIPGADNARDVILSIPEDAELTPPLREYLKRGMKEGVNHKSHTRKRAKWYCIPQQDPPDGFLHYMTKEIPFLVLSSDDVHSTNTIHQVDFLDSVNENAKKWIQLSTLTSVSQLSIELVGRTYGGGVLKIEPSAAGSILVFPGRGKPFPENMHDIVDDFLQTNRRRDVVDIVDAWMTKNFDVSKKDMAAIKTYYSKTRELRLGENARPS